MSVKKPKLIGICGQTATGKSDFAVQIAKEIGGEIISADSRQVYTGLDIGTGKVPRDKKLSRITKTYNLSPLTYFHQGIPHHMLDVISPKKVFSVNNFKLQAEKKIQEIINRGHVPIVCGGTGFYIDTLLGTINLPEVPENKILRKKLELKTKEQLLVILKKLDPIRAEAIDQNNPVRLIRAIEIATALGSVPVLKKKNIYNVISIGLTLPDEVLKEKIHVRLLSRMKDGMLEEAKNLHAKGLSWKRMRELGLEYRFLADHLTKKLSKEEMIIQLETAIWQYAKRQKTWFKRNKNIAWIDPRKKSDIKKSLQTVKKFLK